MSKRGISVLLGLIVLIAAFTLVQDFRFDARLSRERAAAVAVDRDLEAIGRSLADVLTAQAGYVATGQAPGTWMTRAAEGFNRLTTALDARRKAAPSADARAKYDAIISSVASLASVDEKARASIAQEDRLHAADLIYIDARQTAEVAAADLAAVRVLEEQAAAGTQNKWAMLRLAMNGLALVIVVVIAIYFGRALSILREAPPASTAQMLRDLPPPVKGSSTSIVGSHAAPAGPHAAAAHPAAGAPAGARPIPLAAAAELCVDLARILDGRDVPALLERTAALLEAKGIMIWSVDTGGAILRPSIGQAPAASGGRGQRDVAGLQVHAAAVDAGSVGHGRRGDRRAPDHRHGLRRRACG
jgi:hypothetical protein